MAGAPREFETLSGQGRRPAGLSGLAIAWWVFAALVAIVPLLPVPPFWITQLNYIGLYALVALGLVPVSYTHLTLPTSDLV